MKKITVLLAIFCFFTILPSSELWANTLRTLDCLFPGLTEEQRSKVFSEEGLIISHRRNQPLTLIPAAGSRINIHNDITRRNPSFLTESLLVIPYSGRTLTNLDVYNALANIRGLQGRLYNSHRRGEVPLFEEATRVANDRRNTPMPDPPPASVLPASETVFIRLRDQNFGNTFYTANLTAGQHGITYSLTNNRNITYLFITVMREGNFNAILYLEPLAEGMLVYSVAGADVSEFASNRISVPSAISKRLAVFVGWVRDGLKAVQ